VARTQNAARARLARHLAAGARNPGLQHAYATPGDARLNMRWGRAANVIVGEIRAAVPVPVPFLAPPDLVSSRLPGHREDAHPENLYPEHTATA
jgi:hypothetical protein